MYRVLTIIAFTQLLGSNCFKFAISRNLTSSEDLNKMTLALVEVTSVDVSVLVSFDIPVALNYSDVYVFFANDDKEILRVQLAEVVGGQFYAAPYKLKNKMEGMEVTEINSDNYSRLSGTFPREWLPTKCNKISAAIKSSDGQYYNYYRIQNFQISLPDLMVLEEYEKYEFVEEISSKTAMNQRRKISRNLR